MNPDTRHRLIRRLDLVFFAGLLLTSGLAALLFWFLVYDNSDAEDIDSDDPSVAVDATASATFAPAETAAPSATVTITLIPTDTASAPPTSTPESAAAFTFTQTATQPATNTPVSTIASMASRTPLPSATVTDTLPPTAMRTPTNTPVPTVTDTLSPIPSATHTATRLPTATPTLTMTPFPTVTSAPTATPERVAILASETPILTVPATFTSTATGNGTLTTEPTTDTAPLSPTVAFTATDAATASPIPPSDLASAETPADAVPVSPTVTLTITPFPTVTPTQAPALVPHIDNPVAGDIFSPGDVSFSGTGEPGTTIEIQDQGSGETLGTVTAAEDGNWQVSIPLQSEGPLTVIAADTGTPGLTLTSDPVMITVAPAMQPATGAALKRDPDESGRAFTALVALLLSAGGFSLYFAGRLIYLLASDRSRAR